MAPGRALRGKLCREKLCFPLTIDRLTSGTDTSYSHCERVNINFKVARSFSFTMYPVGPTTQCRRVSSTLCVSFINYRVRERRISDDAGGELGPLETPREPSAVIASEFTYLQLQAPRKRLHRQAFWRRDAAPSKVNRHINPRILDSRCLPIYRVLFSVVIRHALSSIDRRLQDFQLSRQGPAREGLE